MFDILRTMLQILWGSMLGWVFLRFAKFFLQERRNRTEDLIAEERKRIMTLLLSEKGKMN